jgi:hypothetical protein
MTALRRRRATLSLVLAATLALSAPVLLSGCSLAKNVVENATGGKVDIGGKSVPKDFPKAEVPLIDGDVVYGAAVGSSDNKVWNVTIKVADVTAFDSISTQLTGAGFAVVTTGGDDKGKTGTFAKEGWGVQLLVSNSGDKTGWIANYTVAHADASASPTPTPTP